MDLPNLPFPPERLIQESAHCSSQEDVNKLTAPFVQYESKLREVYAQYPDHPAIQENHLLSIFQNDSDGLKIHARDFDEDQADVQEKYVLPLSVRDRKHDGEAATVPTLAAFKTNFNLFSESSLIDMDWSNVVAAGSAVVTALLPVPTPHNESKRALRAYYHQNLAPASDVDLFIYGLNEEEAIEKIRAIERSVRDSILGETTTIRTKNAITIVSEYPTRHVQIVLRLYKSISEVLTGFDVDCACLAYDGQHVWAAPRAIRAFLTQVNHVDLTRRSPSYENRLSKYSHRGFEVFCATLDRSRIDPTIYERSFSRVVGLARLLVLEKLPHPEDRENYLVKRRRERGRPALPWSAARVQGLSNDIKNVQPDDIAEWVDEGDVANYHTFTIPYGPKYDARKIEKLLFKKDLLLNAEWNKPKHRDSKLHRHPAFFGSVNEVIGDCCGSCPVAESDEDLAAFEKEHKIYISGALQFLKDDPGRQAVGSFHPLTEDDWTEQAYVGNTALLCQAIVDHDLEAVADWFSGGELEVADVNRRDHAGRTPLQLATICSTTEIVQCLVDHGARLVSRLYNGFTALHIATYRGEIEMVKILLDKSTANAEMEHAKEEAKKLARRADGLSTPSPADDADSLDSEAYDDLSEQESDDGSSDEFTQGSFVKVPPTSKDVEDNDDEPDVYDVDVLAWDSPLSPLHLAIISGRVEMVELLIQEYSADIMLPVKVYSQYDSTVPTAAILTLTLALEPSLTEARQVVDTLLANGAATTQADLHEVTAIQFAISEANENIFRAMMNATKPEIGIKALNNLTGSYHPSMTPLLTAILKRRADLVTELLAKGARPDIAFEDFAQICKYRQTHYSQSEENLRQNFRHYVAQPAIAAAALDLPEIAIALVQKGANINTLAPRLNWINSGPGGSGQSLLDIVQNRIIELQKALDDITTPSSSLKVVELLAADSSYLGACRQGSYKYWSAYNNLNEAKFVKARQVKDRDAEVQKIQSQGEGDDKGKRSQILKTKAAFQQLREKLAESGAKTFRQLEPDAPKTTGRPYYARNDGQESSRPYDTTLKFNSISATTVKDEYFLELFESAWSGNIERVKSMALGEDPIPVAVRDEAGYSPFSIAVVRGHYKLAEIILEIAAAQYKPAKNAPSYRYRLAGHDDNDSEAMSDSGEGTPRIIAELVDDEFTINDIAGLSSAVASKTSPVELLQWECHTWRVLDQDPVVAHQILRDGEPNFSFWRVEKYSWNEFHRLFDSHMSYYRDSLVRLAIYQNDLRMLRFVLRMAAEYDITANEQPKTIVTNMVSRTALYLAAKLGRIEIMAELFAKTGIGLPLSKMTKKSGAKITSQSEFYQGLTVHGRKRQDWAAEGRGHGSDCANEADMSIILDMTFNGSIATIEYCMSGGPLRHLKDFAQANIDADARIQALSHMPGGIDKALTAWWKARMHLALHIAIMAPPLEDGSCPAFDHALEAFPQHLESRDNNGNTPLHTAVRLGRVYAIRALLKAGADQLSRNEKGENVVSMIMSTQLYTTDNVELLPSILRMFDSELVTEMLLQRDTSTPVYGHISMTPLARALVTNQPCQNAINMCQYVFDYTDGKDVAVLDGAGNYIIHYLARSDREVLVKYLIDQRPEILYWENATGQTPVDVAQTAYLRSIIENPPKLPEPRRYDVTTQHYGSYQAQEQEGQQAVDHLLELDAEDASQRSGAWRMNRLMQKLMVKYPGKRKLVSVLDANEVAKRLTITNRDGDQYKRRLQGTGIKMAPPGESQYEEPSISEIGEDWAERIEHGFDEVSIFWSAAEQKPKWDLEKFKEEVKRKSANSKGDQGVEMAVRGLKRDGTDGGALDDMVPGQKFGRPAPAMR